MYLSRALCILLVLGACSDKAPPAPPSAPSGMKTSAPDVPNAAKVSFELDGVAAQTAPRARPDDDAATGQISNMTNQLVLYFYGDAADAPRRAFLSIVVEEFPRTAGETKDARAILTRYEGGKHDPQYNGPVKLHIKSFEPGPKNGVGNTFLASGTFEGELPLGLGMQSALKVAKLTNGVFEALTIQELGKRR